MKMTIVSDNNYVIGSIGHLGMLLDLAMCRTERLGVPFKREEYKWILGVKVIQELETNTHYVMAEFPNKSRTLFGVVVEADYANPNNIQLWENITNKV